MCLFVMEIIYIVFLNSVAKFLTQQNTALFISQHVAVLVAVQLLLKQFVQENTPIRLLCNSLLRNYV